MCDLATWKQSWVLPVRSENSRWLPGSVWKAIKAHWYSFRSPRRELFTLAGCMKSSHARLQRVAFLPAPHPAISQHHNELCVYFNPLAYTWMGKEIRIQVPLVTFWRHTNSTVGLIAISQLRQLVLFNVKCSPIHTLAEILKNTSIANSHLFSHRQSQLLSAKRHCMCSWHNFINNLGKQRILQQIAVAFWLYCATDNNCFKLSVVKSICSCIMKKNHITAWLWRLTACWKATKNSPKLDILIVLPQLLIQAKFI